MFLTIGILILIATFIVGILLTVRHPDRIWHIMGRVLISLSFAACFGIYLWQQTPPWVFYTSTCMGGCAWGEIFYMHLFSRLRKKRFPHEKKGEGLEVLA